MGGEFERSIYLKYEKFDNANVYSLMWNSTTNMDVFCYWYWRVTCRDISSFLIFVIRLCGALPVLQNLFLPWTLAVS
jgi:hypothetical protein